MSLQMCVHACVYLCFRGQGKVFGEGGLTSGLAAFVQESAALLPDDLSCGVTLTLRAATPLRSQEDVHSGAYG